VAEDKELVADKIKLNGAIMRLALLKTGLHGKTISRRPGSKPQAPVLGSIVTVQARQL
jgi:hypothetical protein